MLVAKLPRKSQKQHHSDCAEHRAVEPGAVERIATSWSCHVNLLPVGRRDGGMKNAAISYKRHRFPQQIVVHAVWCTFGFR